jgi:mannose-6-phosphate isomerase-like protein (cupin superfamily)
MVTVINTEELQRSGRTPVFEGYRHGDVPVSFFLVDALPGSGPRLHRHPYAEVFVIQEGRARFTVGGEKLEVTGRPPHSYAEWVDAHLNAFR